MATPGINLCLQGKIITTTLRTCSASRTAMPVASKCIAARRTLHKVSSSHWLSIHLPDTITGGVETKGTASRGTGAQILSEGVGTHVKIASLNVMKFISITPARIRLMLRVVAVVVLVGGTSLAGFTWRAQDRVDRQTLARQTNEFAP